MKERLTVEDKKIHDLVIIGAGPAALSAAIYTSREDIGTLLIEKGGHRRAGGRYGLGG